MAETTGISWCDHTFNPWLGCTKVSPCCDGCYAAVWGRRFGVEWGAGKPRKRTSVGNWKKPLAWNRAAAADGRRHLVFGGSLCDPFDNEVPQAWRDDYWPLIRATPHLTWIIATKRIGNAAKMLPADWGIGYPNVWLLSTVGNQEEFDRDVPKLLRVPAALHGLSIEPMLGPIEMDPDLLSKLGWVISGGASEQPGYDPPPSHPAWHQSLADQCSDAGVPYHFKQWGAWAPGVSVPDDIVGIRQHAHLWDGEWSFGETKMDDPEDGWMDEPDVYRIGTKNSGRLLNGKIHDAFPEISR